MSKTPEEVAEEQREKNLERQWIDQYKKYARRIAQAKAEMSVE